MSKADYSVIDTTPTYYSEVAIIRSLEDYMGDIKENYRKMDAALVHDNRSAAIGLLHEVLLHTAHVLEDYPESLDGDKREALCNAMVRMVSRVSAPMEEPNANPDKTPFRSRWTCWTIPSP